jgi:hypothetical protein
VRRVSPADFLLAAVLVLVGVWIAVTMPRHEFVARFDMASYRAMAESPSRFFDPALPAHHAQRILPPLIVWAVTSVVPIPIYTGFQLLSAASYLAFLLLLFAWFRAAGLRPVLSSALAGLIALVSWPMTYPLYNVYQASDAMAFPVALGLIMATVRRRYGWFLACALAAVLTRQNLVILVFAAAAHLTLVSRQARYAATGVVVGVMFWLSTKFAGGGAQEVLARTIALKWETLYANLLEVRPWLLAMPFLFVLARWSVLGQAVKYWWISVFVLVTVVQPVVSDSAAGTANAHRLIAGGVWPMFLLAGPVFQRTNPGLWRECAVAGLVCLYVAMTRPFHVDTDLTAWARVNEPWLVGCGLALALLATWGAKWPWPVDSAERRPSHTLNKDTMA